MLSNSIKFPNCFNYTTGKTELSDTQDSIVSSIKLIFLSTLGELLGDPDYGTNTAQLFFEYTDKALIDMTRTNLCMAISKYEPRVIISPADIEITPYLNEITVIINFVIRNTGISDTLVLQLESGGYNGI